MDTSSPQFLYFQNPVFHEGLNVTCRKGIKWGLATGTIPVSRTPKFVGDMLFFGHATIVNTKVLPFNALTNDDVVNEHDPSCRTIDGLTKAMKEVYPSFDERELVTLVFFDFHKN